MRNIYVNYFEFGPVVQEMSFKDISYALLSAQPFVQFLQKGIMGNNSVKLF